MAANTCSSIWVALLWIFLATPTDLKNRDVRLSGGANNCSGRVEVYFNDSWATVCDSPWYDDDSTMLCKLLGCGSFWKKTRYEHSHIYAAVICSEGQDFWDCNIDDKKRHICIQSQALGLICQAGVINDSKVTKSKTIANINETAPAGAITDSKVTESRTIGNTNETAPDFPKVHVDYQFLVIACAALAALLLASVFIFSVIIFRLQKQKRKSILNASLPRSNGRWTLRESKEPEFSLQISPLCAAPSPRLRSREPVVAAIPLVPVTTTTLEDEEDYGFSSAPPQPLVTFHNPFPNAEEKEPQAATMGKHSDSNQCRRLRSVTSEGTSSTSSEEQNWYENYRLQGEQNNLLFAPQPYEDSSEYDDVSSAASD